MFGLRKEVDLLKKQVEEIKERAEYQSREYLIKSKYSVALAEVLSRIIKYSREGEPTYYFKNESHASEVFLYINKEEYPFTFDELYEYQSKEVFVDKLLLRDDLAYLTVTGSIDRHMNKTHKTFSFIIDYKHRKYILDQIIENKKTHNLDEVKIPGE